MMSLTSSAFQLFTILATAVVSAVTLPLWNRVRGPRPIRLLSRAALLSTSYALAAIAALVSINIAYGGLISGWGELLDNLGSTPSITHGHRHAPGPAFGGPGPGQGGPGPGQGPGQWGSGTGQGGFPPAQASGGPSQGG